MNIVIQSALGRFLSAINNNALSWSDEYPDAIIFETKTEARHTLRDFKTKMKELGAIAIQDYGLDTESEVR